MSPKPYSVVKAVAILALGIVALFETYRLSQGAFRHGGLRPYLEARSSARQVERAIDLVRSSYVDADAVQLDTLTRSALEAMLENLDPHSAYLDKDELQRLKEDTDQEFGGIGIQVEMRDGRLTVVAPIEGTPGHEAGLLSGDQILAVDGEDLEDVALLRAVKRLRGSPGTRVELSVHRPRTDETFERTVARAAIAVDSVRGVTMLEAGIGYLRVAQFGRRTKEEVEAAIDALSRQGLRALVLDLRNNPGGLLDAAVEVAGLFLPEGELVAYTEGQSRSANQQWRVPSRRRPPYAFPLAVVVNRGSASASEIVAGAMKDSGRATVVGGQTFGKGSVQSILLLGRGEGLRLTTARYYTPDGYVIHERGIEPDLPVETTVEEERQLAIQRSRLSEMGPEAFVERFDFEPVEDRAMAAAIDVLLQRLEG